MQTLDASLHASKKASGVLQNMTVQGPIKAAATPRWGSWVTVSRAILLMILYNKSNSIVNDEIKSQIIHHQTEYHNFLLCEENQIIVIEVE